MVVERDARGEGRKCGGTVAPQVQHNVVTHNEENTTTLTVCNAHEATAWTNATAGAQNKHHH